MKSIRLVLAVAAVAAILAANSVPAMAVTLFDTNTNNDLFGNNGNNCANNSSGFLGDLFDHLFGDGGLFGSNCDTTNNGGFFNGVDQNSTSGNDVQGFSTS